MVDLFKGEKRLIGVEVARRTSEPFTISSVYCEVYDSQGSLVDSGQGSIEEEKVFFFLDTTLEGYTEDVYEINKRYYVYFNIEIAGLEKLIIGKVKVNIKK